MLPLAGVRIVAVEQYGAAPFGTLQLASLGAEVIKVENPRDAGDVSRAVGPHFVPGAEASVASLFYQGFNHNKKSITLDLSKPEGYEILQRLVAGADVLVSNLRGDVPTRLGLTYEQLSGINPKLVCAHLSAYGREGERAAWPGYDYLMQAEAGYFDLTGEPGGLPTRFGLSVVDFMTGVSLALGVVAALYGVVQSSDAVITVGGRFGSLHEFTSALESGIPCGVLTGSQGTADAIPQLMEALEPVARHRVVFDDNPEQLVAKMIATLDAEHIDLLSEIKQGHWFAKPKLSSSNRRG